MDSCGSRSEESGYEARRGRCADAWVGTELGGDGGWVRTALGEGQHWVRTALGQMRGLLCPA